MPLLVGGAIAAIPLSIAGYWVTYQAIVAYRLKVRHRRANRLHKWKWNPQQGWYRVSLNPDRTDPGAAHGSTGKGP
jgi:hypothetical protein